MDKKLADVIVILKNGKHIIRRAIDIDKDLSNYIMLMHTLNLLYFDETHKSFIDKIMIEWGN